MYSIGNVGSTYVTQVNMCICRSLSITGTLAITLNPALGWTLNLNGMCQNYTSQIIGNDSCQNVYYGNTGCVTLEGTACARSIL